jgi:hypothetical protein
MCLKCREVTNPLAQVNLIDDDSKIAFELISLFATISRKKFEMFWNRSFLFKKNMRKESLVACYV